MSQTLAALVTGGGRGIGKSISLRLAQQQPVLLVGRTESDLSETVQEIESRGGEASFVVGDITENETVQKLETELSRQNWSVQALVLNAGIGKSSSSEQLSAQSLEQVFDVNVFSALALVQLVLPGMKFRESGSICFINSTAGLKGVSHDLAYTASKHAQLGFAKALAIEFGKFGISVVPVCPAFVESEMTTRTIAGVAKRRSLSMADARKVLEGKSAQRRIIPAEEVAEVVAFVCSGKVPSLSGNPLVLSGGRV